MLKSENKTILRKCGEQTGTEGTNNSHIVFVVLDPIKQNYLFTSNIGTEPSILILHEPKDIVAMVREYSLYNAK